jgi:hypothetical protein
MQGKAPIRRSCADVCFWRIAVVEDSGKFNLARKTI